MNQLVTHPNETIWTERYRPITIDSCVIPQEIKNIFNGYVVKKEIPHILLSGGPGMGKTTIAKAICKEMDVDFILLNLSNDRGIDILRTTMTNFASTVSLSGNKKVIICDEFDSSTPILQSAFRAFMEEYSNNCTFILTCNYPNRIIQPIHSRCSVVDFHIQASDKAMLGKQMFDRATLILAEQNIEFEKKSVIDVVMKFFPDYRRTLNELQRYASATGKIDAEIVKLATSNSIDDLVKAIKAKSFKETKLWISANIGNMSQEAVYRKLYDSATQVVAPQSVPQLILILSQYQFQGVTAPDPELNLMACCITCMAELEFV